MRWRAHMWKVKGMLLSFCFYSYAELHDTYRKLISKSSRNIKRLGSTWETKLTPEIDYITAENRGCACHDLWCKSNRIKDYVVFLLIVGRWLKWYENSILFHEVTLKIAISWLARLTRALYLKISTHFLRQLLVFAAPIVTVDVA